MGVKNGEEQEMQSAMNGSVLACKIHLTNFTTFQEVT